MSDLSQQPPQEMPAEGSRQPKSAAILLLAILVRIPLIVGGILTGISAFLPWFHLSTSFGDGPHEIDVDPWTMLHFGAGAQSLVIAFAFLLAALGILVSSLLLAFSSSAHKQSRGAPGPGLCFYRFFPYVAVVPHDSARRYRRPYPRMPERSVRRAAGFHLAVATSGRAETIDAA